MTKIKLSTLSTRAPKKENKDSIKKELVKLKIKFDASSVLYYNLTTLSIQHHDNIFSEKMFSKNELNLVEWMSQGEIECLIQPCSVAVPA